MLIRNYGLFWNREKVWWGKQRSPSNLLGKMRNKKRGDAVDFRYQIGIYVLYDDRFKIVYAGKVGSGDQKLQARLNQHRSDHLAERWHLFSWFGLRPVNGNQLAEASKEPPSLVLALEHIEAVLLATTEPPLNLRRGDWGDDVEEYLQYVPTGGPKVVKPKKLPAETSLSEAPSVSTSAEAESHEPVRQNDDEQP
jgi:hypothetical protein